MVDLLSFYLDEIDNLDMDVNVVIARHDEMSINVSDRDAGFKFCQSFRNYTNHQYDDGTVENDKGYNWADQLQALLKFKYLYTKKDNVDEGHIVFDVIIFDHDDEGYFRILKSKENCSLLSEVKKLFEDVVKSFGSGK